MMSVSGHKTEAQFLKYVKLSLPTVLLVQPLMDYFNMKSNLIIKMCQCTSFFMSDSKK